MIAVRTSFEVDARVEKRSITVSAPYFSGQAQLGPSSSKVGKTLGKALDVGIHLGTSTRWPNFAIGFPGWG